jgi:hypothetical protein
MSMQQYPWDVEERAQDAVVAHLKNLVGRKCKIVSAPLVGAAQYPLVTVEWFASTKKNDTSLFTGKVAGQMQIVTTIEAVNNQGEEFSPERFETAQQLFRVIKSEVRGALAGNTLHEDLNSIGAEGVKFSMAHLVFGNREVQPGKLIQVDLLDVIAQPTEV